MTNEEAIYRLKNTAWLGTNKDREETEQAVDMAIHALHQPPNEDWERYSDLLWKEAYERGKQEALSAEAESDDIIIKGAKGIKDGLYNIKDGKMFQFKAKGGTVRTYQIVSSADAVRGEWKHTITGQPYCSNCEYVFGDDEEFSPFWDYCPMCGAKIKGGDDE